MVRRRRRGRPRRDGRPRAVDRRPVAVRLGRAADRARAIREALTEALSQFDRVFSPFLRVTEHLPVPSTRRFRRARATFDGIVHGMIADRRRAGLTADDLLTHLLRAQEDGQGMTDDQVRDEVLTLFLAGHETTAVALTWTFWLLAGPEVDARLDDADGDGRDRRSTGSSPSRSGCVRPRGRSAGGRSRTSTWPAAVGCRPARRDRLPVAPAPRRRWWPDPDRFDLGRWAGRRHGATPPRLPPVRWRPPHVHRRGVRPAGGDDRPGRGDATLAAHRGARGTSGKPAVTLRPGGPVLMRVRSRRSG